MNFLDRLFPERRNDPRQLLANELARQTNGIMRDLIALRKQKGLTQGEVAKRMNVSREAVAQLESHDANPTLKSLRRYALAVEGLLQVRVRDANHWTNVKTRHIARLEPAAHFDRPEDREKVVQLNLRRLRRHTPNLDAGVAQ